MKLCDFSAIRGVRMIASLCYEEFYSRKVVCLIAVCLYSNLVIMQS